MTDGARQSETSPGPKTHRPAETLAELVRLYSVGHEVEVVSVL
jgi:hypothetical protein